MFGPKCVIGVKTSALKSVMKKGEAHAEMRNYVQLAGLAGGPPLFQRFPNNKAQSCKKTMVLTRGEGKREAEIDFCIDFCKASVPFAFCKGGNHLQKGTGCL